MIEIGRESRLTWASRRVAEALGGMAALLLLVWLVRGFLGIQGYSLYLLLVSFAFVFLDRIFRTRTSSGVGRAISSFLGNLTIASVVVIVLIWFLGWVATIQRSAFPASISSSFPDLVIAAIATGLGAYAAHKVSPRSGRTSAGQPPFAVGEGTGPVMGEVKLAVKHDTVGVPIRRSGRTVGCVLLGDVSASFETPMGAVNASLAGPVTTVGIPFKGNALNESEVVKMTGKKPKQLVAEARIDTSAPEAFGHSESVDLPFIHVDSNEFEDLVEVGPIRVRDGPGGGHVGIGPFSIDSDEEHSHNGWHRRHGRHGWHGKWIARGAGDSFIGADGSHFSAKWNGSSLSLDGSSMKLAVGSDSFSYSPAEVRTASPLHTLSVTQDKITLDTRKFTLKVSGDNVVLRTEDKTTSTESKALAGDLRALLTETAKKQVKDVMEGLPIDLNEMLTSTEEVLARHE